MLNTTKTVRYTATLPSDYIDELKQLAKAQQIPSVNFAIRQALDEYLKQAKRREYDEMMKKASAGGRIRQHKDGSGFCRCHL